MSSDVFLSSSRIFILHKNLSSVFITKVDALHRFCVFVAASRSKTRMAEAGPIGAKLSCGRATTSPSPLVGEGWVGGREVVAMLCRFSRTPPPPPPPPPGGGGGRAPPPPPPPRRRRWGVV